MLCDTKSCVFQIKTRNLKWLKIICIIWNLNQNTCNLVNLMSIFLQFILFLENKQKVYYWLLTWLETTIIIHIHIFYYAMAKMTFKRKWSVLLLHNLFVCQIIENPTYITSICPERGLAVQGYKCAECKAAISFRESQLNNLFLLVILGEK